MKNGTTMYAVSLKEALTDIRKYKDFMKENFGIPEEKILKAFTLHAEELLESIGIDATAISFKYPKARVYIGKTDGAGDESFKLFLVPVDHDDKDVILEGPYKHLAASEPYVFDFTMPCPNTCDKESPLSNA